MQLFACLVFNVNCLPLEIKRATPNKCLKKFIMEGFEHESSHDVFHCLSGVPNSNTWNLDSQASYIYYCANETVHGVEFHEPIKHNADIPIVVDMSSNMLTKSLDISKVNQQA